MSNKKRFIIIGIFMIGTVIAAGIVNYYISKSEARSENKIMVRVIRVYEC